MNLNDRPTTLFTAEKAAEILLKNAKDDREWVYKAVPKGDKFIAIRVFDEQGEPLGYF